MGLDGHGGWDRGASTHNQRHSRPVRLWPSALGQIPALFSPGSHSDNNILAQGVQRPFGGPGLCPTHSPTERPSLPVSASAGPSHAPAAGRARPGRAGCPDLAEGLGQAESGGSAVGTQPYGHLPDTFCDRRVGPNSPREHAVHPRGNPGIHRGPRLRTAPGPGPRGWDAPALPPPALLGWQTQPLEPGSRTQQRVGILRQTTLEPV